jgi:hypothetical protein
MSITTVHDPIFSRLQSAMHHAIARRARTAGLDPNHPASPSAELSSGHPAMQAVAALGNAVVEGGPAQGSVLPSGSADMECARLAWQYMQAKWDGNQALAQQIQNELKFSSCDPLWSEVMVDYEEFVHSGNTIPYIALQPGAGVIPIAGTLKVALLADWGTGTGTALNVLAQAVAMARPPSSSSTSTSRCRPPSRRRGRRWGRARATCECSRPPATTTCTRAAPASTR